MDYTMREKVEKAAKNKYEAVIVASRLARKINSYRLNAQEQLSPDAPIPNYDQKVTSQAIQELSEGKVKYNMREEISPEEDIFSE